MDYEIIVPRLDWLKGGEANKWDGNFNIYHASVGTDAFKGCLSQKIFNYRVWLERVDNVITVFAATYPGMLSFENTPDELKQNKTFHFSPEGRDELKNWIESCAKDYYDN